MPRLRHVILFFLCLLACATQVQANWVTHSNYKFTGKERNVETDSKPNECLHLQFGAAEVGNANKANVETDSKPNECLHLQFGAAEVGNANKANVETDSKPNECLHLQFGAAENAYFALLKWTSGWVTAAKKRRHWQTNGLLVM